MTSLYKPIPFFSNYAISDNGVVYRISDGTFLDYFITGGYKNYSITDDAGVERAMAAHRLVAMTHHGLPEGWEKLVVNHINGNKFDNRSVNLEWVTFRENLLHAGLYGLTPKCIPIQVRNVLTDTILEFPSFLDAAHYFGLSKDAISWRVNAGEHRVDELFNQYRPLSRKEQWVEPTEWNCGVLLRNAITGEILHFVSQNAICAMYNVSPAYLSLRITDPSQPLFRLHDGLYQITINTNNVQWVDHGDPYLAFENATQVRFIVMYNPLIENRRIFFSLNEAAAAYGFKKNVPFYRAKANKLDPWHDGLICHYLFNR